MSLQVKDVMKFMESFAPHKMAEAWDNTGLMAGDPDSEVKKLMLTLDVTPDVVEQAVDKQVQLIVSHHPLLFEGVKSLARTNWRNRMLAKIISSDIAVYSAHTNLDAALGGVNDALARKLGLREVELLQQSGSEKLFKVVVFIPEAYAQAVAAAMTEAGAGHIGCYSDCTFQTKGIGAFRPSSDATPFIGAAGRLERVAEVRLETVVTEQVKQGVLDGMIKAHPYEEVAYDVYELANDFKPWGIGRIGELPEKMTVRELAAAVKQALHLEYVVYADAGAKVKRVAVVGGSGADYAKIAALAGADALITGDVKYHAAQEAKFSGLSMIDAGHQGTELPILDELSQRLSEWGKDKNLQVIIAQEKKVLQQM